MFFILALSDESKDERLTEVTTGKIKKCQVVGRIRQGFLAQTGVFIPYLHSLFNLTF